MKYIGEKCGSRDFSHVKKVSPKEFCCCAVEEKKSSLYLLNNWVLEVLEDLC